MKTNGGLNSVCSSRGDETSTVEEDRENRSGPLPLYSAKKARNGLIGDDLCPNRGSPPIDAKTLLFMEIASAS